MPNVERDEASRGGAFASHNDAWGTDSVAHRAGITFGKDDGYVVAKSRLLAAEMAPLVTAALPGVRDDQLELIFHVLVEYSVDLLLAEADPSVGQALMQSAGCPEPAGVDLVVDALEPFFGPVVGGEAAAGMIRAREPQFRYEQFVLGAVLSQPDALHIVAQQTAAKADAYLGLPPGSLDPVRGQLGALAEYALLRGKALCAPDLLDELEATVGRVNGRLSALGIAP